MPKSKDPNIVDANISGQFIAGNAASSDNFRIVGGQLSHWDQRRLQWTPIVDQQHLAALCCSIYATNRTLGLSATLSDAVEGRVGRLASGRLNADFANRGLSNVSTPAHLWGFAGGVFDVNQPGDGLRPPGKDDYVTHFLPYDIELGAEIPRELVNVIFSATEQSDAMTDYLLDQLAYILFAENHFQKFYSWYGIGGAGKGLLTRLLISLLGRNRCYSLDTDALYQGRSDQLVAADGKQLLVLQEADRAMPRAKLKALTGQDMIQVRALYGTPFEFVFQGHFLMVSNPPFPESMVDTGILRRLVPIQFSRAAAMPDLTLEPRLMAMLGRILGALFGRYQDRVKHWTEWPTTAEVLRDLEFYKFQEDSPKAWLIDRVKKDIDGALKMSDIMARYESEKGELKDKDRERIKKAFQRAIRSDLGVKLKNSREYAASWIGDDDTPGSVDHTQDSVQPETIDAGELPPPKPEVDSMKADYYAKATHKKPSSEEFGAVLWNNSSRELVEKVRAGEIAKADALPALTPSVCGAEVRNNAEAIRKHNGWLVFDVDGLGDEELAANCKQRLVNLDFVVAAWLSPSGRGVKFMVRLAKPPESEEAHKAVYADIVQFVRTKTGIVCDASTNDPARLCFLSWDELPFYNFEAELYRPQIGARAFDVDYPIDGPWPEGQRHNQLVRCAAHYARTTSPQQWAAVVARLRATWEWEKRDELGCKRLSEVPKLEREFTEAIQSAKAKYQ